MKQIHLRNPDFTKAVLNLLPHFSKIKVSSTDLSTDELQNPPATTDHDQNTNAEIQPVKKDMVILTKDDKMSHSEIGVSILRNEDGSSQNELLQQRHRNNDNDLLKGLSHSSNPSHPHAKRARITVSSEEDLKTSTNGHFITINPVEAGENQPHGRK
ncbi:hypothetical protein NE237_030633 [Protea cynaroides]|uniref:Uncharacterized protein n=1 Tax=Protea cynaroides TaxID=273540 RepID=A0A9Q0GVF7_9MAGN|nr:hypothetical protein NE237_030633 [Protea cynaroides]